MSTQHNTTCVTDSCNFLSLSAKFQEYHLNPSNVLLHFITTPLGLIGLLCMIIDISDSSIAAALIMLAYLVSLLSSLSLGIFLMSVVMVALILLISHVIRLRTFTALIILIASYFLQDLAHIITGEETFQSSYSSNSYQIDFTKEFLHNITEQSYYLIPLCNHVAAKAFFTLSDEHQQLFNSSIPEDITSYSQSWSVFLALSVIVIIYNFSTKSDDSDDHVKKD